MSAEQKKLDDVTKHRDQLKAELDSLNPMFNKLKVSHDELQTKALVLEDEKQQLIKNIEALENRINQEAATVQSSASELISFRQQTTTTIQGLKSQCDTMKQQLAGWRARAEQALKRDSETFSVVQHIAQIVGNLINTRVGVSETNDAGKTVEQ